jgi:hypothetical protein
VLVGAVVSVGREVLVGSSNVNVGDGVLDGRSVGRLGSIVAVFVGVMLGVSGVGVLVGVSVSVLACVAVSVGVSEALRVVVGARVGTIGPCSVSVGSRATGVGAQPRMKHPMIRTRK